MSLFFPSFFNHNGYFIDEKVQFFRFHNHYKVFDKDGLPIGKVVQNIPSRHKIMRFLIHKQMMPFHLDFIDSQENILVTIKWGWTFWMSKVTITDPQGMVTGYIRQ